MRRAWPAAAALAAALSLGIASQTAAFEPASRMLVYAQEWSLWPSRHTIPRGRVIVQLWNRGQDAHNLHIRRLDRHGHMVGGSQSVALASSGSITKATWTLAPGRYELFCSMPGHIALGMHTVVVVQ
jgi:plastocyanin